MRTAFLLFILAHGLIHLLGFFKAFGLSEIKALTQYISKPVGVIWLVSFLFFVIVAIVFALKNSHWWLYGFIAVFTSQLLIFYFWQDAKYGTIANVIILVAIIIGYGTWSYNHKYENEVRKYLTVNTSSPDSLLTETDIRNLPGPVKKYIRLTGSLGKPKVKNFKIEFKGQLRKNEQSEWMTFSSEQFNFIDASARLFFMKAVMKHLPVAGFHCFINGTAFMDIRLFSLIRVQYQAGKEMDTAETVTFFNDMCCMAPATLIDQRIKWFEGDTNKVKAEFTNNHITISAWLYFNEKGELINFISDDRFAVVDNNTLKRFPWSTPMKDYKELNGYNLARYANAIYSYPEGNFCYGNFRLSNIEYNCKEFK